MSNVAYAHIGGVQALILDEAGNAAPGGQVLYSAVVLGPDNNTVAQPFTGTPGNLYVSGQAVSFSIGTGASTQKMQTAVVADIQAQWHDSTITVVFL